MRKLCYTICYTEFSQRSGSRKNFGGSVWESNPPPTHRAGHSVLKTGRGTSTPSAPMIDLNCWRSMSTLKFFHRSTSACPERGPVKSKQCEETSPKCALSLLPSGERLDRREPRAVRFRTVKEHFGRRLSHASGSSNSFSDNLYKYRELLTTNQLNLPMASQGVLKVRVRKGVWSDPSRTRRPAQNAHPAYVSGT